MNCSRCGAATVEGAAFCGSCGNPLASAADELSGVIPAGGPPFGSRLPGEESASFGRRLSAHLIDLLLLWSLLVPIALITGIIGDAVSAGGSTSTHYGGGQNDQAVIAIAVWCIGSFAYFWASAVFGGTGGMRALGVRIVSDDGHTGVSVGMGFLRTLVLPMGASRIIARDQKRPANLKGWIKIWAMKGARGNFSMLRKSEHRTLHDMVSRSRVVKRG